VTADGPAPLGVPPPPRAKELLAAAGLHAKKSWGQNFLLDQHVLADIAALAGAGPERPVLELGAGLGALTHHLLARGGKVLAVERDRELVPVLRDVLSWAGDRLELLEADAAQLDYAALAARLGAPLTVTGNLPYQLSSRILVDLADARPHVARGVLLLQREVAERLTTEPGSRVYGLLSVLVQRNLSVRIARGVPPGAFLPRPKVHSAVVVLEARAGTREPVLDAALTATARAAFRARRKTLRAGLALALEVPAAKVEPALLEAGIAPEARAETLGVDELERLGAALARRGLLHLDWGDHGA
jgi:16S rRNA (adenine1518-N6/adenine1519-N6)-dimethyltransferase